MTVKQVKSSFYIISSLYTLSASFIWGINTLFLLDSGLDILEVFIANAVFTASMTIFEIPTGVVADTRGRRFSFLISLVVLLCGTFGYLLSSVYNGGVLWFSFFSILLGLGFTFYSGAVEAWVVDELDEAGYRGKLDEIFSKGASISGITMILGTISGGLMAFLDMRLPYIARITALILLFFFALYFMKENGFQALGKNERFKTILNKIVKDSIELGWKKKTLRLFMLSSLFHSAFMMWAFYASQPYLLELLGKPEAFWISGLVAASIALAQIGGNSLVGPLIKRVKRRTTILIVCASVASLLAIALGLAPTFPIAMVCLLLFMSSFGLYSPIKQSYMHQQISKENRATIVSFDSLIANGGAIIGQPGLGLISKLFSISMAYIMGSLFMIGAIPFLLAIKKQNDKEDSTS